MSVYLVRYPQDEGEKYTAIRYPAGEWQVRVKLEEIPKVKSAGRVIVYATVKDGEVMKLGQLINAIYGIGLEKLDLNLVTLVLPYLPYSRADRRFVAGDCNGIRVLANFLNSSGVNNVVTLDVHSKAADQEIPGFINVSPAPIIKTVQDLILDTLVILPDEGANRYGIAEALRCSKKRDPETGALSGFMVPSRKELAGRESALIVDDICDGGGTFIGISELLREQGIKRLYLYVTHGIFSKGVDILADHFEHIFTTNSFLPIPHPKLTIIPCGGTILRQILPLSELYLI